MKENKNLPYNNNNYINKIKELEKEIEKYKNYCLLPGEKLISLQVTGNNFYIFHFLFLILLFY